MSACRASAVPAAGRAEPAAYHAGARDADVRRVGVRAAERHAPSEGVRRAAERIVVPAEQSGAIPARLGIARAVVGDPSLLTRAGLPAGALSLALPLAARRPIPAASGRNGGR